MKPEREDTFLVDAHVIVSDGIPAKFKKGSTTPPMSYPALVREATTSIPSHAKEVMSKLVLETVTAQQKGDDHCLVSAQEFLIECIVEKVENTQKKLLTS